MCPVLVAIHAQIFCSLGLQLGNPVKIRLRLAPSRLAAIWAFSAVPSPYLKHFLLKSKSKTNADPEKNKYALWRFQIWANLILLNWAKISFARWISEKPSRNGMIFYVSGWCNYLDLSKIRLRLASFGYNLSRFTTMLQASIKGGRGAPFCQKRRRRITTCPPPPQF